MNSPFPNKKFIIDTNQAPRAIGPYSQAVGFGGLLFVSGQIPVDPQSGEVSQGGVEAQTRRVMDNLQAVLMAAGLDFSHVLKTTIYLRNMNDYDLVNDVYSLYFDYSPPARVCIEVSRLPKDVLVEVDAIAAAPTDYEQRAVPEDAHGEHAGPDEWEAQHLADAKAAHDEIGTGADEEEPPLVPDGKYPSSDDEADDDGSEDVEPSDAEEDTSDEAETAGDEGADDEGASSDDGQESPGAVAGREKQHTQELSVDDLQQAASPPPLEKNKPLKSKIKVPKPKKSDD